MISRMDLKKALEANDVYEDSNGTLLYSLGVDAQGAALVADGYGLRAVLRFLGRTPADIVRLSDDELRWLQVVSEAFNAGGACFLRAKQMYEDAMSAS